MSARPSDYLLGILKERKEQLRKYKRFKERTRDQRVRRSLEKICSEDEKALKRLVSLLPNKKRAGEVKRPAGLQLFVFGEKATIKSLQKQEQKQVEQLEKLLKDKEVPKSVKNTVVTQLIGLGQDHIRNLEILKY